MSIHFKGRRGVCDARGRAPPAFYPARRSLRWAIPDAPGRPYPDSYAANAPAVPGRSGETGSPCRWWAGYYRCRTDSPGQSSPGARPGTDARPVRRRRGSRGPFASSLSPPALVCPETGKSFTAGRGGDTGRLPSGAAYGILKISSAKQFLRDFR